MNPEQTKLRQEEGTISSRATFETAHQPALEFATVEKLLRHDAAQNPVPAEVTDRLHQSIDAEPKPKTSWIKKLFH